MERRTSFENGLRRAILAAGILCAACLSQQVAAAADAARAEVAPASYMKLHPDFVVNLQSTEPAAQHFLLATVQVMSRNEETLAHAQLHLPALRHHMLLLLADQTFPHIAQPDNQRALQDTALELLNRILAEEVGPGHALEGVYFTDFIIE